MYCYMLGLSTIPAYHGRMGQAGTRARKAREQRERVIDGAIRALSIHGVEGLTHRRIADAAGVSLSSTTYYFATLDDVLEAAMLRAVEDDLDAIRERFVGADAADAPELLAGYLVETIETDRPRQLAAVELAVAAARRAHLRPIFRAWDDAWSAALEPLFGPAAELVSAAISGLMLKALMVPEELSAQRMADAIRAAMPASREQAPT